MFGKAGEMMVIVMVLMAVVSTGSAEVLAATSIVVYDIYQLYLKVLFSFFSTPLRV
jgi:Na+/proline symporter